MAVNTYPRLPGPDEASLPIDEQLALEGKFLAALMDKAALEN